MAFLLDSLGISVLERGWLSSNTIIICDDRSAWVVDTGYSAHAAQTVELVKHAIGRRNLVGILNTHLHSDHCGGNAALKESFPGAEILIPPGLSDAVSAWDTVALTYQPTGQHCPQFLHQGLLQPGAEIALGRFSWEIHSAPGHDPHAVVLYERQNGILISGDALWENGFGVVFPELEGVSAFDEVKATLDMVERLAPHLVIPGHGRPFEDVSGSMMRARNRLHQFQSEPKKHAEYAAKVLVKFHLLEKQRITLSELEHWYRSTPYFALVGRHQPNLDLGLDQLLNKLVQSAAARVDGQWVVDL